MNPKHAAADPLAKIQAGVTRFIVGRASVIDDPTDVTGYAEDHGRELILRYGLDNYVLHPLGESPVAEDSRVYSVQQLLALDLPAPRSLIEGLLHESETIVVAGRQKVGKSRLIQQMALCLVNGEPFLGMPIQRPVRVLMIDLENRLQPLSQRFRVMAGTRAGDTRLFVWCASSLATPLPDATKAGSEMLSALVASTRPDVLMIDPWRLWLAGDENDAQDIVRGLKLLASVRESRPTLAIVIVHHERKEKFESPRRLLKDPSLWADAVSGHHALMSHVDACFGLERQFDGADEPLIVFGGIARHTEPRTLVLEEDETLRFRVAANESAARQVMTPAQAKIWESAKKRKSFRFNELATVTTNRKAISMTLVIAESHGLLRKEGTGYVVTDTGD